MESASFTWSGLSVELPDRAPSTDQQPGPRDYPNLRIWGRSNWGRSYVLDVASELVNLSIVEAVMDILGGRIGHFGLRKNRTDAALPVTVPSVVDLDVKTAAPSEQKAFRKAELIEARAEAVTLGDRYGVMVIGGELSQIK